MIFVFSADHPCFLAVAIFDMQHKSRKAVHEKITEESVAILTAYRTNCAATTSAGQLILPEAFKLLPVYMHASMRSQALRGGWYFSFSFTTQRHVH